MRQIKTGKHERTKNKNLVMQSVSNFFQKSHMLLLIASIALTLGLVALVVTASVLSSSREKMTVLIEDLASEYEALNIDKNESMIKSIVKQAETDKAETGQKNTKETQIKALLEKLTSLANKKVIYVSARAWSLIATIYMDQKELDLAKKAWMSVIKVQSKSYLAPIALYNAASLLEEQGENQEALDLYTQCITKYKDTFPLAPRVFFAIGRVNEALNNKDAALSAYKKIVETWPNDSWTNYAQTRILLNTLNEDNKTES